MTIVHKRDAFRNDRDDATIIVEQYAEKGYGGFMWRYYIKYDAYKITSGYSDGLWHKPSRKWLKSRF